VAHDVRVPGPFTEVEIMLPVMRRGGRRGRRSWLA
jgi:hypothetical protein